MTKAEAREVGKKLAQHKNEWVVLDAGQVVAHGRTLKTAMKHVPKDAQSPRIYFAATGSADMVLASF